MNFPLKRPPRNLWEEYAEQARHMLVLRNRYTTNDYDYINQEVAVSQDRAGPPMLRLAKAAWSLEDRRLHPDDPAIVAIEENDFSHLMAAHRSLQKSRYYHVWDAMEDFVKIREREFGEPVLVHMQVPDLDKLDWRVVKSLLALDDIDMHYRPRAQKPELEQLMALLVRLHPLKYAEAIVLLVKALHKLHLQNLGNGDAKQLAYAYQMANKAFWHYWLSNQWLRQSEFAQAKALLSRFYYDFPPFGNGE